MYHSFSRNTNKIILTCNASKGLLYLNLYWLKYSLARKWNRLTIHQKFTSEQQIILTIKRNTLIFERHIFLKATHRYFIFSRYTYVKIIRIKIISFLSANYKSEIQFHETTHFMNYYIEQTIFKAHWSSFSLY